MMIYMGNPLAEWEAELMTGVIDELGPLYLKRNDVLFIEQDFSK